MTLKRHYHQLLSIIAAVIAAFAIKADAATPILGQPDVDIDTMWGFVRKHNANFPRDIAETYHNVGLKYGVRGDIAFCQAILETGWFKFADGTAVESQQFNFCGLGVINKGDTGAAFSSVAEGVTAQIQHLFAYATNDTLPAGETVVDPRFIYVTRGCAPTWEDLNGRWAANERYSELIMGLYASMSGKQIQVIEVNLPDESTWFDSEPEDEATSGAATVNSEMF